MKFTATLSLFAMAAMPAVVSAKGGTRATERKLGKGGSGKGGDKCADLYDLNSDALEVFPEICSVSGSLTAEISQLDGGPLCIFGYLDSELYDACTCHWIFEEGCGPHFGTEICPVYGAFKDMIENGNVEENKLDDFIDLVAGTGKADKCGCGCENDEWAGTFVIQEHD